MTVREVQLVAELDHPPQKIGTTTETVQDPRKCRATSTDVGPFLPDNTL